MKAVIKEKYFKSESEEVDGARFDNFFNVLHQNLHKQTVNIKKMLFMTKLLYKPYCTLAYGKFSKILKHVWNNFYSNVIDLKDIEEEMSKWKEDSNQEKTEKAQYDHVDSTTKTFVKFRPSKVTFYDEIKLGNKTSYTFVEAMILLSAFLAAHNKETNDENMFACARAAKSKKNKKKNEGDKVISHIELGKTKKVRYSNAIF